jgi:hypothetical protein
MSTSLATLAFSLRTVCVDLSSLILGEHRAHIFAVATALTNLLHLAHLIIAQAKAFLHSSHAIAAAPAAFTLALVVSILMLRFTAFPVPGEGRRSQQCHQRDDNNYRFHVRFSFNGQTKSSEYAYISLQFWSKYGEIEQKTRFSIVFID